MLEAFGKCCFSESMAYIWVCRCFFVSGWYCSALGNKRTLVGNVMGMVVSSAVLANTLHHWIVLWVQCSCDSCFAGIGTQQFTQIEMGKATNFP